MAACLRTYVVLFACGSKHRCGGPGNPYPKTGVTDAEQKVYRGLRRCPKACAFRRLRRTRVRNQISTLRKPAWPGVDVDPVPPVPMFMQAPEPNQSGVVKLGVLCSPETNRITVSVSHYRGGDIARWRASRRISRISCISRLAVRLSCGSARTRTVEATMCRGRRKRREYLDSDLAACRGPMPAVSPGVSVSALGIAGFVRESVITVFRPKLIVAWCLRCQRPALPVVGGY